MNCISQKSIRNVNFKTAQKLIPLIILILHTIQIRNIANWQNAGLKGIPFISVTLISSTCTFCQHQFPQQSIWGQVLFNVTILVNE